MFKKSSLLSLFVLVLVLCSFFGCNNAPGTEAQGKDGASIVWKGSFASSDQIENPEYLWAYYNTEDGCSYIYDGEKWTLLAAGEKGGNTVDGSEVFVVTYQTGNGTDVQSLYCTKNFKLTAEKLPQLTKQHYDFNGWYDGETAVTAGYKITKNTTLEGKWSKKKYKVTYVCDDDPVSVPESFYTDYGTVLDSSYFPDFSNEDYDFVWKEGTTKIQSEYYVDHDVVFTGVFSKHNPVRWGALYFPNGEITVAQGLPFDYYINLYLPDLPYDQIPSNIDVKFFYFQESFTNSEQVVYLPASFYGYNGMNVEFVVRCSFNTPGFYKLGFVVNNDFYFTRDNGDAVYSPGGIVPENTYKIILVAAAE